MLPATLQVMDVMSSRKIDSASSMAGNCTRVVQGGYPEDQVITGKLQSSRKWMVNQNDTAFFPDFFTRRNAALSAASTSVTVLASVGKGPTPTLTPG